MLAFVEFLSDNSIACRAHFVLCDPGLAGIRATDGFHEPVTTAIAVLSAWPSLAIALDVLTPKASISVAVHIQVALIDPQAP